MRSRTQLAFLVLLVLLAAALVLNVNTGSVKLGLTGLVRALLNPFDSSAESVILWKIRLPRLAAAAVFGGALSVSGFLLQTFFRNPIAGPFVLGISSGAKMMVGFVLIVLSPHIIMIPSWLLVLASLVGSLVSMMIVLALSRRVKSLSTLIVAGIMIGYICSAVTDFLIAFAGESHILNLATWSLGSFSGARWVDLGFVSVIIFVSLLVAMLISKPIGAFQLGEGYAQSMGANVRVLRVAIILLSSILSACVTAFAGPISFVGIAVPHITKLLFRTAKPIIIIPGSFLCGAVFCMLCDLIARTAFSPTELSISAVTSIFGAPIVIWLMLGRRQQNA